nr:CHC2 zinc finger domain-containing protein [Devosia aurantiaca]
MRFSDTFLEEIRQRLPITQVVGEHVLWDKRKSQPGKGDMWACCPFHAEKARAFMPMTGAASIIALAAALRAITSGS